MEKQLGAGIAWSRCEPAQVRRLLAWLQSVAAERFARSTAGLARCARLPFYRHHRLVDLRLDDTPGIERAFLLWDGEQGHWLDGRATAIYAVNEAEFLELDADTVVDYVRLFTGFVRGDGRPFTLIDLPAELTAAGATDDALAQCRASVAPPALHAALDDGRMTVRATMAFGDGLYRATFAVSRDGSIEMVADEPVASLDGVAVPSLPDLPPQPFAASAGDGSPTPARQRPVPGERQPGTAERAAGERLDDRSVTGQVVAVLLGEAVRASMGHTLLQRFNHHSQALGPIGQLARFVEESAPIIVIEAEIPFIEDIVAGLLNDAADLFPVQTIERASAVSGDDSRCSVDARNAGTRLHLISFHAYRSLWDAEWTAHQLAVGTAAVFIGCDRRADVPEPLRRVADLVLRLPRIDRRLFLAIFTAVFGAPPPAGWHRDGDDWTRYLLHSDFHAPLRLRLGAAEAVAYLRERSGERLQQISAAASPGLDELHGLGEARQVATDLIADIAAARAGRIPWTAVDRGLLLVGPPGTGKTTLARAIARACDVKFIHASAASWQSAGALDLHLRAIRSTFAEARRYAPSILFIDEVDSIGNREALSGSNAVYQTEVINAVLEQMQGLDPDEPVIVVAATNFADKVDPALRRAGRLDQLVVIPLPNTPALEQILAYHLQPYRAAHQLAGDVDVAALARLAFGATGADVEFFVRGAARRARKSGGRITQADLLAEVTRRPRHADGALRLTPAEMRRVAVHEAGHALAALQTTGANDTLSYISIIPRLDGSLGFTATVPPEAAVMTRRQVLERLQRVLAGRAAEELVYGAAELSLSSGGGADSDLAVATRMATHLVCMAGLGTGRSLHWSAAPTPAQLRQVDALLRQAYRDALALLARRRPALDRLAAALVERQELDGASALRIARTARPAPGKRAGNPPARRRSRRDSRR